LTDRYRGQHLLAAIPFKQELSGFDTSRAGPDILARLARVEYENRKLLRLNGFGTTPTLAKVAGVAWPELAAFSVSIPIDQAQLNGIAFSHESFGSAVCTTAGLSL
jgi:hypothetical protein